MLEIRQYYHVLELNDNASPVEIKKAYRRLAKIWHPDRFYDHPQQQKQATEKFQQILEAYEILINYQSDSSTVQATSTIYKTRSHPDVYYQRGVIYAEDEDYQEAIEEFTKAIRLDANYIKAYQYRGFVFSKLGYENRAEADFRTVIRLRQTNSNNSVSTNSNPFHKDTVSQRTTNLAQPKWQNKWSLAAHSQSIHTVAISQDGRYCASGSSDNTIKLWELETGQMITKLQGHIAAVRSLAFHPDGQTLISSSDDKTIRLWNLNNYNYRILGDWKDRHCQKINTIALSLDGNRLVSGSADKTVKIWFLKEKISPLTLTGYGAEVLAVAISNNRQYFAAVGLEQQLRIRQLETGKLMRSLKENCAALSVAFSTDNQILATGGYDRTIHLWNVTTGQETGKLEGHSDRISSVIFSPDTKTLISSSWDKTVKLWDIDTQQLISTLTGHFAAVLTVAVSSDGKTIISGGSDYFINLWQI